MDLTLTQDQQMIRDAARGFLAKECPMSYVRAMERDERGCHPEHWNKMAELGWMGLALPQEYGGAGSGFLELCLLLEAQGRFRCPGPFFPTVVLAALPIVRFGSEVQKSQYLPAIAGGGRIMTYAGFGAGAGWDATQTDLSAEAEGDDFILDGTALFVPYAKAADALIVAACTSGTGHEGVTLFIVDMSAGGITREPLETIGADHPCAVRFDNARVPGSSVLHAIDQGYPIVEAIQQWGAAARCAEMVGGAERVLEMTLEYATQRTQFGKPIGSFQAIQHHCADMAVDVLGARFVAYEAIWRLSEGLEAAAEVSMAKAWVSDAYCRICAAAHQVHGAIGFTREYDLQLYTRHAKAAELSFGDALHHRERLAQLAGL